MLSTVATTTATITATTVIGVGGAGAIITVLLILFLCSKELISSSRLNSPTARRIMNMAIVPLLAVFVLDIAFMVMA